MFAFIAAQWFGLGDEFPSVLAIVICPAMNFGDLTRPVAMSRAYRSCPFQGSGAPWVLGDHFSSLENRIEEIEYEQQLNGKYDHRHGGDEPVQVPELVKGKPVAVIQVTAGHTCQSFVVHRPEYQVGAGKSYPEMDIRHRIVQVAAIHFREPVINAAEHAQDPRDTHNDMEMRDHEISIMQLDIQRRVAQEDP